MEAVGAAVSIGTILSGLKRCYLEIQDMLYAWRHGPKDLQDFSLKVKLFERAFQKVPRLIESDPKHAKDIKKLGHHIWFRLKTFLKRFQDLLPALERSKSARAWTKITWYFQKKTADSLLGMISRSEISLNLWVSIDMVQSRDKRIKTLEEAIRQLELLQMSVPALRDEVTQLQHETSELKQQCREQIKEMEALQREHKTELREQRDRGRAEANTVVRDVVDRFLSETIRPLIRENAVVLELDKKCQRDSSIHHSSHSNSNRSRHRRRTASTEDVLSRSTRGAKNSSTRAEPVARRTLPMREPSLQSGNVNQPVEHLPSRKIPRVSPSISGVSSLTPASQGFENYGEVAEPELQDVRLEHTPAGGHQEGTEAADGDQEYARSERSNTGREDGGTAATEVVEEPEAHIHSIDCSPRLETSQSVDVETVKESTLGEEIIATAEEIRDTDSIEITEQVTEATSFTDVELQEYGRKIEQQSNEHTDNAFRDKRAMMRREQEEAEARLFGRPQGHEDARKYQRRKLGRNRDLARSTLKHEKPRK